MTCRSNIQRTKKKKLQLTIVPNLKNYEKNEKKVKLIESSLLGTTDRTMSEISELLKEWTEWYNSSAYPDSTTIWKLLHAPGDVEFRSRIPAGVMPPRNLNKIQLAMNKLLHTSVGRDVAVCRMFYCLGVENTIEETGFSKRQVYERKRRGEAAIEGFLSA